jgi:hypothetical protein
MKTIPTLIFAVAFILTISGSKVCCGQVVTSGNVTAEVIESVSAAMQAFTSFELGATALPGSGIRDSKSFVSERMDLGAITINSGKDVACNIVVISASLSDSEGNAFILEPSIKSDSFASAFQTNGSQTIQIAGIANFAPHQASGRYEGSYSVVVAYN